VFLKLLRRQFLGNFAHENVVIDNLLGVGSKEIVVEGEGTRRLSWRKLKVAHLFAGKGKLVLLGDSHDCRVEGAVQITSDLGHT